MLADPESPRNRPPGTRDRGEGNVANGRGAADVPGRTWRPRDGPDVVPYPSHAQRAPAPPGMEPEGASRPIRPMTTPRHERTPHPASRPLALSVPLRSGRGPSRARRSRHPRKGVPKGQRSTLDTVRSIFEGLDADRDGRVTAAEARNARVNDALFKVHDVDESQGLDRDEFTLLYRDLLTRARRAVPADLQSEVSRIQLRRRAAEDAKRKKEQVDAEKGKAGPAPPRRSLHPRSPRARVARAAGGRASPRPSPANPPQRRGRPPSRPPAPLL